MARGATDLAFYYMGYYIHSCPKMRYKAEYAPSELLCPKDHVWVRIDDRVLTALDERPYVEFSKLPGVEVKPNLVPGAGRMPVGGVGGGAAAAGGVGGVGTRGGQGAAAAGASNEQAHQQQGEEMDWDGEEGGEQGADGVGEGGSEDEGYESSFERVKNQHMLFCKQMVPWHVLKASGLLGVLEQQQLQQKLADWVKAVGASASRLLYLVSSGEYGMA